MILVWVLVRVVLCLVIPETIVVTLVFKVVVTVVILVMVVSALFWMFSVTLVLSSESSPSSPEISSDFLTSFLILLLRFLIKKLTDFCSFLMETSILVEVFSWSL